MPPCSFIFLVMNLVTVGTLLVQIAADLSGVPYSRKISKLIEEFMKSEEQMLKEIAESKDIQTGKILGLIGAAQQALSYYISSDLDDDVRLRQLKRAWGKFEDAYYRIELVPKHHAYLPKIALSIAICHTMLHHNELAVTWAEKALADNEKHQSLNQDDLTNIKDILSSRRKYLPE